MNDSSPILAWLTALTIGAVAAGAPLASAKGPPAATQAAPAHIDKVQVVRRDAQTMQVVVEADLALTPHVLEFKKAPTRLVVDFPGASFGPPTTLPVEAMGLQRIRVAVRSTNPPSTRLVIDLERWMPYRVEAMAGGVVIVISEVAAVPVPADVVGGSGNMQRRAGTPAVTQAAAAPPVREAGGETSTGVVASRPDVQRRAPLDPAQGALSDSRRAVTPSTHGVQIHRLVVEKRDAAHLDVVVEADGALAPQLLELKDPPLRLVVDFPGAALRVKETREVGSHGVDRVRIAKSSAKPAATRLVLDLSHWPAYRVESRRPGRFVIVITDDTGQVVASPGDMSRRAGTPAPTHDRVLAETPPVLPPPAAQPAMGQSQPDAAQPQPAPALSRPTPNQAQPAPAQPQPSPAPPPPAAQPQAQAQPVPDAIVPVPPDNPAAPRTRPVAEPADPPPAPASLSFSDYIVGPQDVLSIAVWGNDDLTGKYTVEADGGFTFPLIGRVAAGGLKLRDVETGLRMQLAAGFLKNPQVSVAVDQYRSQRIFVVGEVRQPGAYPLTGEMTLIEALARAGSTTSNAGSEAIVARVPPTGKDASTVGGGKSDPTQVVKVDLKALQQGVAGQNVAMRDGDTVFVSRAETIYVTGFVKNPGAYALQTPDTTVLQALALAGGVSDRGASNRVRVSRIVDGKKQESRVKLTDVVRPGDTIIVPERYF